jgi:nicotinamidase-related amidase/type 1 glutamine amidotransferase
LQVPLFVVLCITSFTVTRTRGQDVRKQDLSLTLRSRTETSPGSGRYHTVLKPETWDPSKTALIVCDVWDLHHCFNAVRRVEEFGPRLNEVVQDARRRGVTIIHAPSDCMAAYADHPARKRAIETPKVKDLPPDITSWCSRIPAEEQAVYPIDQSDGGEDDDPREHADWAAKLAAMGRNPRAPWKQQADLIGIDAQRDFISDKGDEVWSILQSRGIENVVLTGVHTNMCVLGRPFGLRQMARNGKHVVLMRDMTDTMYNPARWPYVSHFTGTDFIVEHIEKYVAPTITSDQFLGGKPFRFKGDTRPHLAIVMAEDEYETERTLPEFARNHLGKTFRVSCVFGSDTEPGDIPGIAVLDEADLALISVRRRPIQAQQLAVVRRFVDAGRPLVGIRTASHAFSLRTTKPAAGLADWPEFDAQVWGGNYTNHYGNDVQNHARIVADRKDHPILTGMRSDEFTVGGALYKVSPVNAKATVLLSGRIEGQAEEPLAWTFTRADGGRSFYTSLGYKTDFESNPDFQRLLLNALHWAAGLEAPQEFRVVGTIDDYRNHWMPMPVPCLWEQSYHLALRDYDGPAWYRCLIRVPQTWDAKELNLRTASMPDDELTAFFNGEEIDLTPVLGARDPLVDGGVLGSVPPEIVEAGDVNLLAVRIMDRGGDGGLPFRNPVLSTGREKISLEGYWQFRIGDDPAFATLPLPARFAASTDYIFEPDHPQEH